MFPKPFCPLRPDMERNGYDHFKAVRIKPATLRYLDVPLCRVGMQQSRLVYFPDLCTDGMPEHAKLVGNLILAHPYFSFGSGDVLVLVHRDYPTGIAVYVFSFFRASSQQLVICYAILILPNDALSLLPSMERSVSSFSVVIFA